MPTATLTMSITNSFGITYPEQILSDDGAPAHVLVSNTGNFYFRFSTNALSLIPANAVITGVSNHVKASVNSLAAGTRMTCGPGDFGGSTTSPKTLTSTGILTYSWGAGGDPMGATSVNDLTTCSIKYGNNAAGSVYLYFYYIFMYVDWQLPTAGNRSLFFGTNF